MLMKYLQKHESAGVIEYLVNKLYSESYENLDLYLPQISYLILTKENEDCVSVI